MGWIPGLGISPGEGKGYPLQYSGLENCMDCIVHGVAESDRIEELSLSIPERDSVTNGELLLCLASLLRAVLSSSEQNLSGPGGEKEPGEGGEGPEVTPDSKRSAPPLEIPVCSRSPKRRGSVCCRQDRAAEPPSLPSALSTDPLEV